MRSLITRWFGPRRARRAAATCFIRENGPIAYEIDLFGASPRDDAQVLLQGPLSWAWRSGAREWTHLTAFSLSAFLGDLPAGALVVAVDGELPTHLTDDLAKGWLRGFCRVQPGPVDAVIHAEPDRRRVFVQQHPSASVTSLLDALGVDRRGAGRAAYARLGPNTLESLTERLG